MKTDEFQTFEKELLRKERVDVRKNFRIIDALYREAVALGTFPLKDPIEGLEVDIRVARVITTHTQLLGQEKEALNSGG